MTSSTPPLGPPTVSSTGSILEVGRNCHERPLCTDSGLLIDGHDYYAAFYRAAQRAEHYLLISGWQFDHLARLMRADEVPEGAETRFLPFLEQLCREKPGLRVYILAWDFSAVFAHEREWFQPVRFHWTSHERISFRFDSNHPIAGSHHHKIVVVDGCLAFTGGMDLCTDRWDERDHRRESRWRVNPHGRPYGPYHDIQGVVAGPVVASLRDFFRERWLASGGDELILTEPAPDAPPLPVEPTVRLGRGRLAVSRTLGATVSPPQPTVREIRQLYLDAVDSASALIYLENQYITSVALLDALERRMRAPHRSKLQIAFLLPTQPEKKMEAFAIGVQQARLLERLKRTARETGHALRVYCTSPNGSRPSECSTFVHSKLMIVDDRLLIMGSANTTNRSFGLDSEVDLVWEASDDQPHLRHTIRRARVNLLAEHSGARSLADLRALFPIDGLIDRLDQRVGCCRLFDRDPPNPETIEGNPIAAIASATVDPEQAHIEEDLFEVLESTGWVDRPAGG